MNIRADCSPWQFHNQAHFKLRQHNCHFTLSRPYVSLFNLSVVAAAAERLRVSTSLRGVTMAVSGSVI